MSTSIPVAETAAPTTVQVDPRGPRFGASLTSALLLAALYLGLTGLSAGDVGLAALVERLLDPGFIVLTVTALTFLIGAVGGIQRHPYGWLFRTLVRPHLAPSAELEDAAPPTFAQLIGLLVAGTGVTLHCIGVGYAIPVAAGAAFAAAFLNAAFGFCLGCQLYLLLARVGIVRRGRTA